MATIGRDHRTRLRAAQATGLALTLLALAAPTLARAQATEGWQACAATADSQARLACFDRWAQATIANGPVDPAVRRRLSAFSSSYEFAVWAANVRAVNARLRGDQTVLGRWQSAPAYRANALH